MRLPKAPSSVITGAGSGFGRAIALELAGRGASLVLGDVDLPGANETARLARAAGATRAEPVMCDVTKLDDVRGLASMVGGDVDLVVNNAGVSSGGPIGESSPEDWRWTIEVDLFGVINGCHVFVPILRKQGHGHVLNVASAAGLLCAPNMGAYNVAKVGVVALSETLSGELSGTDIGVTVLCPTFFRTNIAKGGRFADEKMREQAERLVEKGKDAGDVARAALRSVEAGDLYSIPMADGRWFWRLKRLAPRSFRSLAGRISRHIMN
jgi:NAD(P)-dependent dehydrogenase (short-subunit alcohol dehydrogenase family)